MICPHASPVPFTSIWKPYSTIRPITGIATRSWGLLRSSRSASVRYAGSMAGKRRYSSTGTPRNTTGKHFVGIPPQGSRHSTTGYLNYRQVVQGIPTVGSSCTMQWYGQYQARKFIGTCIQLTTSKVYNMNLRTYFHYLCSLYQQDCIKRKHEIRSKQKSIAYYRRSGVDYSRGQYPQDRDNDMADRFPILAFQDRRGHSRIPSLLFVCFQKALLQAHQTYRRKKEREELPFFFL